ncbi:MAG: ATP-binding cassette domain-containing protein, partial [Clostridia bacterium]|nr:ATP-binding cassette domain-containing protein [Clostridia bacterium]
MLDIINVSKTYGSVKALTDFSYTFGYGVYALLGPNGSGKSTLMNIITDNLRADSGEITYK